MIIVSGVFTVIEKLHVRNIIISKQIESSENYDKFLRILKQKRVNIILVKAGSIVKIDNDSYFEIIWPEDEQVKENILNNNSIVGRFIYKNFSMLFTGDIEEIAEKEIINRYKEKLKANVIKIAHHGSKTSSTEEFIKLVEPQIALIGVGEKNTYGHPSCSVISRLESMRNRYI